MIYLITHNPIPYILAVLIGLITAWWIWGRVSRTAVDTQPVQPVRQTTPAPKPTPAPAPKSTPAPKPAPTPAPAPAPKVEAKPAATAAATGAAAVGAGAAATASAKSTDKADAKKPKIAAAVGEPDDLTRIKGIGPKLKKLCYSLGVKRFDQIAAWKASDIAEVDGHMDSFKGRIDRDEWVAQAKLLAAGKDAEHVKKYGK